MVAPVTSDTFKFADGNAGHSCNLGSAPSAGQWDVLCINSNTIISTPAGFTKTEEAVGNQGAYIFTREAAGSEGSTVTITTSGNENTSVHWSRWPTELTAVDTSTNTQATGAGNSTPAHTTGSLAEATEVVIAFGALHSIGGLADQVTPVWSSGYTAITGPAAQGSGVTGANGFVAYKDGAGTAAEAPQVTWSGSGCQNRYMLAVSFTVSTVAPITGDGTGTFPALTGSGTGDVPIYGSGAVLFPELQGSGAGTVTAPAGAGAPHVPVAGWYGLLNIAREAARLVAEDAERVPLSCPNDGEPLRTGPGGVIYCPYDGWRYQ